MKERIRNSKPNIKYRLLRYAPLLISLFLMAMSIAVGAPPTNPGPPPPPDGGT